MKKVFLVLVLGLSSSYSLLAGPVNIGFFAIDANNPSQGLNTVSVSNFTGTTLGCGNVDTALPVCTNLSLSGQIQIFYSDISGNHSLTKTLSSPLGPGSFSPQPDFEYDGSLNVSSIIFSGSITPTSFLLANNSTYVSNGVVFAAALVPGVNDAPLLMVDQGSSIPEPATIPLVMAGLGGALYFRRYLTGRQVIDGIS